MDFMPLQAVIFQSIPESIAFISLGLALAGVWPPFRRVLAVSVFYALLTPFIRLLPIMFPVNVLLCLVILTPILGFGLRIGFLRAAFAAVLGLLILAVVEGVTIPLTMQLTGITFAQAVKDPWLRIILPLPEEIIVGAAAYFCWRRRFSLVKPEKDK